MLYYYDEISGELSEKPVSGCNYGSEKLESYEYSASDLYPAANESSQTEPDPGKDSLKEENKSESVQHHSRNNCPTTLDTNAGSDKTTGSRISDTHLTDTPGAGTQLADPLSLKKFQPYDMLLLELYVKYFNENKKQLPLFLKNKLGFNRISAEEKIRQNTKNRNDYISSNTSGSESFIYSFRNSSGCILVSLSSSEISGITLKKYLKDAGEIISVRLPISENGFRHMLIRLYADTSNLDPDSFIRQDVFLTKERKDYIESFIPEFDSYPPVFLTRKEKQKFIPDPADEKHVEEKLKAERHETGINIENGKRFPSPLVQTLIPGRKARILFILSIIFELIACVILAGDFIRYFSGGRLSSPGVRSIFSQLISASAEPKLQVEFCIFYEGWENIGSCTTGQRSEGKNRGKWDFRDNREQYQRLFPAVEKIEVESGIIRIKARDESELEGTDLILEPRRDRFNQPEWIISPKSGCIRKKLC